MILKLPVEIWYRKRGQLKRFRINLNEYRNAHHMVLHSVKKAFTAEMIEYRALRLPFKPPYLLEYTLYWDDDRQLDVNNILSIADKFTADALVKYGILPEDHKKVVAGTNFRWGGLAGKQYITLEIKPYQEKERDYAQEN